MFALGLLNAKLSLTAKKAFLLGLLVIIVPSGEMEMFCPGRDTFIATPPLGRFSTVIWLPGFETIIVLFPTTVTVVFPTAVVELLPSMTVALLGGAIVVSSGATDDPVTFSGRVVVGISFVVELAPDDSGVVVTTSGWTVSGSAGNPKMQGNKASKQTTEP